jgi:hypothetical protein
MNDRMHSNSALRSAPRRRASDLAAADGIGLYRGSEQAAALLKSLFHRFPTSLSLRLWEGKAFRAGAAAVMDSPFTF